METIKILIMSIIVILLFVNKIMERKIKKLDDAIDKKEKGVKDGDKRKN